MKKIIIFLILLLAFIPDKVKANSTTFYEAEYIDGIYINKVTPDNKTIYFQKARFFREVGSNKFAYCIQPFTFFNSNSSYESTTLPTIITNEVKVKISLIAYFGYGYQNHTDPKWYAITQLMIWQAAEPKGNYYFTQTLNGIKISPYDNEIAEINHLINDYQTIPSFANSYHDIIKNTNLKLNDENNVLSKYTSKNSNIIIDNNTLIVNNLPLGENEIILQRTENNYNKPILFYQSQTSQALLETGDLNKKIVTLRVNVKESELIINKLDYDTKTTANSGEGQLSGAIYQLYDNNMKEISILKVDEYCTTNLKNLDYGIYYLKEISAGEGYEIDPNIYSFEITPKNPAIVLTLHNKIVKSLITIKKVYETNTGTENEVNITFNIKDSNGKVYTTITTNEEGIAQITLPYGKYQIEQITTKEGYSKIEPFKIEVTDTLPQTFNLTNYKIKVPNTSTSIIKDIVKIIKVILWTLTYA